MTVNEDLFHFLSAAPSPYHAVAEAARRLDAAGWVRLDLTQVWPTTGGRHYVRRGGAPGTAPSPPTL